MDLFSEGQKLTINFLKESNMVEIICHIDKVFDDRLELVLPQYFMRYIGFLQVGKRLTAKVFTKIGTIDFNTVIISSPLEDTFSVELDYNSVKLRPASENPAIESFEKIEIKTENDTFNLKTLEISTEHVKFSSDKRLLKEMKVDCVLTLPKDYGVIRFKGVISDIDPVFDNEYTAKIITMTEEERQQLLYYMYMYSKNSN